MRRAKAAALLLVSAVTMAAVSSVLAAVSARADGDQGAAVLSQINTTRAAQGCGPVAANAQLTAAAARHAKDMLVNKVQSHTGSDGSSVVQRIADAGYGSNAKVGEIVFWSTGPGGT